MRSHTINLILLLAFICLQILQLFVLPIYFLPENPCWGYLLLVPALFSNSWWSFIHESIHGCMFANKSVNRVWGRVNAILFGSPFDLLRWGHLLHHAFSRTERERSEVYIPNRGSVSWFKFNYYFRLLGGLYLFEVLGGIVFLLPKLILNLIVDKLKSRENVIEPLFHKIMETRTLADARIDVIFILSAYGFSFSLYGHYAWMLLASILLRGFLISVVDNVFHYETPLEQTRYARNLYMPDWLSNLILHFNLHGVHHLHPHLPWWQLSQIHVDSGGEFQSDWSRSILAQFKGPIPAERLTRNA